MSWMLFWDTVYMPYIASFAYIYLLAYNCWLRIVMKVTAAYVHLRRLLKSHLLNVLKRNTCVTVSAYMYLCCICYSGITMTYWKWFSELHAPIIVFECFGLCCVTVAYLEGARCDAPLWSDHENFLQATLYEKVRFLPFFSKNCKIQQCLMVFSLSKFQKNGRICGFHWILRSKKCFSFRGGGFAPLTLRPVNGILA